jgi:hypothetical protein
MSARRYFPSKSSARELLRRFHLERFGSSGARESDPRRLNAKLRRRQRRRRLGGRR